MNKITLCLFLSLMFGALFIPTVQASDFQKPLYGVKILDITPVDSTVETPAGVSYTVKSKKVSGIGDLVKSDKDYMVYVTDVIEYKWDPVEYSASSVTDDAGSSIGSARDTWEEDSDYYKVTAENDSGEYQTDFTFSFDIDSDEVDDVEDIYIQIAGDTSADVKVKMYDGNNWKTVRTFELEDYDVVDFSVGGEYVQADTLRIRIVTEDDDPHTVKMEYLAVIFKSNMDVTYTLPADTSLVRVTKCCGSSVSVDHTYDDDIVSFDLNDYVDFDDKTYGVDYVYKFNVSYSDFLVKQTVAPVLSLDSPEAKISYEQGVYITLPPDQNVEFELIPTYSVDFERLLVASKTKSFKRGSDKISFEIDSAGSSASKYYLQFFYSIDDAVTLDSRTLYNQTNYDMDALKKGDMNWVSEYVLNRKYDVGLGNVSILHEQGDTVNETEIATYPYTEYESVQGDPLKIKFPLLMDDISVTIKESGPSLVYNCSGYRQVESSIPVNKSPDFVVEMRVKNPSDKGVTVTLRKSDILSMMPELRAYMKDHPDTINKTVVDAGVEKTLGVRFNTTPVRFIEGVLEQNQVAPNQPVGWTQNVKVINSCNLNYSNVSWKLIVPPDTIEHTVNKEVKGTIESGLLKYDIDLLEAESEREFSVIYFTYPIKRTDNLFESGIFDKKIEKRIVLTNPSDLEVTVRMVANLSDVPNLETDGLGYVIGEYSLVDREDDGVNDIIKWVQVVGPYEEKVIVLKGSWSITEVYIYLYGVLDDMTQGNATLVIYGVLSLLPLSVLLFLVIRYIRYSRRKKMILYIATIAKTLKSDKNKGNVEGRTQVP